MIATRHRRKSARAFSLIEVMISSALFFVGLEAVFTGYHTATVLLAHHRHLTRAVSIAEGTLEELVQRYPGDPLLAVGDHTPSDRTYDRDGVLTSSSALYTASWTVQPYAKVDGVRQITATVRWSEDTRPRQLQLTTWRH